MSKRKPSDSSPRAGARRPAASAARRSDGVPVLPAAMALLLIAVAAVLVIVYVTSKGTTASAISGITCDTQEHVDPSSVHYHAHLSILYQGTDVTVPSDIGIPSNQSCIYWMHTHDATGVIHVEAPKAKAKDFTLGEFFAIWGKPLSTNRVVDFTIGPGQKLVTYIDGKQQPDGFDPSTIKITEHEQIVLEITPPVVDPPPSYTFQQGL
jgi:hypothetical protein